MPMVFDPGDIAGSANETIRDTIVGELYAEALAKGADFDMCSDDVKIFPCVGDVDTPPSERNAPSYGR
jgi:hypothetical protein